jgi:hypothetical protein
MTQNRELKRRIRMRMRATGESYMQARAALVPATPASRPAPRDDRSTTMTVPPPAPAWTPRAQILMREAESLAIGFRHSWVGTEHLLLALLEERNGIAGQLLEASGVSSDLKREIVKIFGSQGYYTGSVMDLDEDGNPVIDPETGIVKQHEVPPQKE